MTAPYHVTVVGLGKIGLPLAAQYASRGATVIGTDIAQSVVDLVNQGLPPFPNEPGLESALGPAVSARRIRATTDTTSAVADSDVVVVAVPVVIRENGSPDYDAMDSAACAIGRGLRRGTLVVFETTLPVGTTRGRLVPQLEAQSGLQAGTDFSVVYSPERVMSGRVFADLRRYPKLVGGLDAASTARATEFYTSVLEFDRRPDLARGNGVWDLGSLEAAELAKLAETTYRDVNIALANEFARYADRIGIDVYGVIEGANSQPYSHIHRPGVAVGGHCIPVYPRLYLSTDPQATMPAAGRQVNEAMPAYACDLLEGFLGALRGTTVVILGAAYRGGVKETAFSGVFPLAAELGRRGAAVFVHDPLFSPEELALRGLTAYDPGNMCDAAILQADHHEYLTLTKADLPGTRVIIDGRAMLDPANWPGVLVKTIGRPHSTA